MSGAAAFPKYSEFSTQSSVFRVQSADLAAQVHLQPEIKDTQPTFQHSLDRVSTCFGRVVDFGVEASQYCVSSYLTLTLTRRAGCGSVLTWS
eukprot:3541631-Rhodomonas_salina.2